MYFTNYIFLFIFLPIVVIVFYVLPKYREFVLIVGSAIIIAFVSVQTFALIVCSACIMSILKCNTSKLFLIAGILSLLGLYFVFNSSVLYKWLYIQNVSLLNFTHNTHAIGATWVMFKVVFLVLLGYNMTFKQSFYQLSFFPTAINPPIILNTKMLSLNKKLPHIEQISKGLYCIVSGLFRVYVISAILAYPLKNGLSAVSLNFVQASVLTWSNFLAFYFEWTGILLIASGMANLFGLNIAIDFNNPLKRNSPQNFWKAIFLSLYYSTLMVIKKFAIKKRIFKRIIFFVLFTSIFFLYRFNYNALIFVALNLVLMLIFNSKIVQKLPSVFKWFFTLSAMAILFLFLKFQNIQDVLTVIKGLISIPSIFLYYNEFYMLWTINANWVIVITVLFSFLLGVCFTEKKLVANFKLNGLYIVTSLIYLVLSILYLNSNQELMIYEF